MSPPLIFNAVTGEVPRNKPYEFSIFKSLADFVPKTITLDDFIDTLHSDEHQAHLDQVRNTSDPDTKEKLKAMLPAVTVSGVFSGGNRIENMVNHSGLICLDFDAEDNPALSTRYTQVKADLTNDQFSLLTFTSAGGEGIAVFTRIDPDCHAEALMALEAYYQQEHGLKISVRSGSQRRLRFVSHDPEASINPNARMFRRYSLAKDATREEEYVDIDPTPTEPAPDPEEKPAKGLPTINGAAWLDEDVEPRKPVLDDLIDEGDMLEIIAPSKMRKSFFMLQLAICCAAGAKFLKWIMHGNQKVLVFNLEIKSAWQHRRYKAMCKELGLSSDMMNRIEFCNTRGLRIDNMMHAIAETVRAIKPTVVIIDPLYLMHDGDENNAAEMKPLIRDFMTLIAESGACLISVHHDPKGKAGDRNIRDRGAGSSIFGRACDARITLTPHAEDDMICVDTMARNFKPAPGFVCSFDGCFKEEVEATYEPETSQNNKGKSKKLSIKLKDAAEQAATYLQAPMGERTTDFKNDVLRDTMGFGIHKAQEVLNYMKENMVAKSMQYQRGYWIGTEAQIEARNLWIEEQKGKK